MTRNIQNEQYLYLIDNLMMFFTLIIDKIIQNSKQSFDSEKLQQVIDDQQSEIQQLIKQNEQLKQDNWNIQLQMETNQKQAEESIDKLENFIIKQKQEIEGYVQRIKELEIEEDPNSLYQNLEINLYKYNRLFNDIENQMNNDYKENIASLNNFAHSIQENTLIMQNIKNNQKNEGLKGISKKYGLTLPLKCQKKQNHPFEFYLISKWKHIKIENY